MLYQFLAFSTVFNGFSGLIAGWLVYSRNPHHIINRTFAVFCFFFTIWAFGYFFPFTPNSYELTMLSFQILHTGALFIAVSQFHFATAMLGIHQEKKNFIIAGYLINLIILPFVYTDLFIPTVVPKGPLTFYPDVGPVYHIWLIIWLFYIVYALYLLYQGYKVSIGIKKMQIKYILMGSFVTYLFGSSNFLLAYNINIPPYLNILSSAHVIFLSYAILKYRFLDLKVNLSQYFKTFIAVAFSIFIFFLLRQYFANSSLNLEFAIALNLFITAIIYSIIKKILSLTSVYRFFHKTLNYHTFNDFKNITNEFRSKVTFYTTLQELNDDLQRIFCRDLKISLVNIITLKKHGHDKNMEIYKNLIKYFHKHNDVLITEELSVKQERSNKKYPFYHELQSLGALCFPLYQGEKRLIGFFVLGQKPFADPYSVQELRLLHNTARYISLSLSVILYNFELQAEIAEKTKHLQHQNKKIKEIMKRQSDFIAVTAHEFRTPLSVALFQLDETIHATDNVEEVKENLDIMAKSLDNLKLLTQKLFDVQQYDLNKVILKLAKTDISAFVYNIYLELRNIMQEKFIHFTFVDNVKKPIYANIDKLQMRQVFHNILTNAYKFTPRHGRVEMKFYADDTFINVDISDSGEGVAATEKKRIFEKFQTSKVSMAMGIGLGLYISKKIVDLHSGHIYVEDSKFSGAKFCVQLSK